jgi:hypothetical protein
MSPRHAWLRYVILSSLAVSVCVIEGCSNMVVVPHQLTLVGPNTYNDFLPVDPLPSPQITYPDSTTGAMVTKAWTQLSNAEIQNILTDTHAQITVGKFDADANLTYLAGKVTGQVGTYRVIMDYCEYVSELVKDENGKTIGQGRVGVGLRLTADVTTKSANVNLGSLLALGVAASTDQLSGTMSVDSIGIRIAGDGGPILSNTTIDETSIQKTLESIAVIQSKIADTSTKLDPQLLAVKPISSNINPTDVAKKLTMQ